MVLIREYEYFICQKILYLKPQLSGINSFDKDYHHCPQIAAYCEVIKLLKCPLDRIERSGTKDTIVKEKFVTIFNGYMYLFLTDK